MKIPAMLDLSLSLALACSFVSLSLILSSSFARYGCACVVCIRACVTDCYLTRTVGGTKYGKGHLIDTNNMGGWSGSPSAADTCVQTITTASSAVGQNPIAWQGPNATFIYIWAANQLIEQYR